MTGAGHGLTITGNTTLGTVTGLSALAVSGTSLLNGNVTTTGAQSYASAVTLGGNDTLTSTSGGAIDFASTLNGATSNAQNLAVSTAGATTFAGAVGSAFALNSLRVNSGTFSADTLNIGNGGLAVTTSGGGIGQKTVRSQLPAYVGKLQLAGTNSRSR